MLIGCPIKFTKTLFQYQTAFAEKNLNDLKYEMLEKQVGLLNSELKALKAVNDILKKSLINVVGPRSKLMNDINIATGRILHQHITNASDSNLRSMQNPLTRKLNRPTPPPPQQAQAECSNLFQENAPESVTKNKENLSNIPIPGNFRPIQNQRKINRPTPPPPQQQTHAETSDLNKVVVANVKVPNINRPKGTSLNKLPADQTRPPSNVIGQKRSRQTTSPDIVVVDLETKVEASSPQPSYQQRLQSLADQQKSTSQNIRSTSTPTNSSESPKQATEIMCTDSADNETEFFIGEDHSPDSELRQGYTSIYCETY